LEQEKNLLSQLKEDEENEINDIIEEKEEEKKEKILKIDELLNINLNKNEKKILGDTKI